ncbi:MAG: efflux RND transporter periplasmic adaptor subunit [Gammaproteobacteria bacterium]
MRRLSRTPLRARGTHVPGLLALVAALALAAWFGWAQRSGPVAAAPAPARVPVSVEAVARRDIPHLVHALGTVTSLHRVLVRPQVDGVLTAVHFTEGEPVARGAPLATIDDRAIVAARDAARAALARTTAELRTARLDLTRYRSLEGRAAVARQVIDQQAALVAQLEAGVAAHRAAIAAADVQVSHTRIVSPVAGRVGLRRVDPGNVVRADDPTGLVEVTQVAPIAVVFALPQEQLPAVRSLLAAGDARAVRLHARAGGAVLGEGRLTLVDNVIDETTGTFRVKAEFANADERLWPGQFVSVELATTHSPAALVVSQAAVLRGAARPYVYRLRADAVEAVDVEIAHEDERWAVIAAGLAEGDVVVTDGQSRLAPGVQVRVLNGADDG